MDKFKWDKLQVSVAPIRMRKKMFGKSDWFGLNVSFVDRTPVFVQSVFET